MCEEGRSSKSINGPEAIISDLLTDNCLAAQWPAGGLVDSLDWSAPRPLDSLDRPTRTDALEPSTRPMDSSRPVIMSANNNNNSTSSLCSFSAEVLQDSQSVSSLGLAPRIQDFDILKPISRGAFGKVFLCHRRDNPERKLAVKVLKKHEVIEKNLVSQVIAERNALAITKSPFCVNLLYCLQTHNNVFLVSDIYPYLSVSP